MSSLLSPGLFTDDGREATVFHECRSAPHDAPISPEDLARGGAYAASLAWSGMIASSGRRPEISRARHRVMDAADAFIEHTAHDHPVSPAELRAAKRLSEAAVEHALQRVYH
ncbi:hypothetical protein [Yinghuangia seranimata]|uniref:hypothetical protein n=1 Tax=Yinghuangia seranimata TaxID=408067 RepID=UPI00248B4F7B|nr:hypothetical protein [Yinghuangia seranimata]MDI2127528.1 hypothetical protein [Yinghuangia seranimata]